MQYTPLNGNPLSYSTIVVKNLRWPGSICAAKNGDFINMYIGDGNRIGGNLFFPNMLQDLEKDADGLEEHPEPNPDKEPVIPVEKDTDDMEGDMMEGDNMEGDDMDDN